jgi:ATP-dependent DNA helicase RecQ
MAAAISPSVTERALASLRALTADADAGFREDQLEAIADLVADRARVLCVQRTGWGKSAVYFVATALLRAAGAGPTLIVSPLLALMRNQIAAAERLGLRAHTINSTNREEWATVRGAARDGAVDLLLISPERLNNPSFRDDDAAAVRSASVGLLVIDEAHCISDWGHDFRPDYRRVKRDGRRRLGPSVAVLGTTATANDRVVADVVTQLGPRAGAPLRTYRGPLAPHEPAPGGARSAAAGAAPRVAGRASAPAAGIRDRLRADQARLPSRSPPGSRTGSIAALPYSGEQDDRRSGSRPSSSSSRNEVKAVVATSALGMGYDKPDLGVRRALPGARIGRLVLPAGRPRRPRDGPRRRDPAARRRGPADPGLLHRAGVPRPRAGGTAVLERPRDRRRVRAARRAS